MLPPTATGSGESDFSTRRFAPALTVVEALLELLPGTASSGEVTVAVLVTIVPVPPTGGEHVHPAPGVTETNVVPAGVASEREVFDAAFGPALVTVIVYVMFDPATTGSGESTFETERSAVAATAGSVGGNSTPTRVNAKMIQRSDAFTVAPPPRVSWSGTSSYTLVVATATAIKGVGAQRSRNRVPSCRGGKGAARPGRWPSTAPAERATPFPEDRKSTRLNS